MAETAGKAHILVRRLRTLTVGLLTPFYFIQVRSLISLSALVSAPLVFLALFAAKKLSKMILLCRA